ncbi:hypothetical protein Tco_0524692 [Tanacetum coccineum]
MVGGGLVGRGLSGRVLCGEAIQGAGCAGVGRFAVGFWLNREGRCADWVKVVGEVAGRGGVRGWGCSGPVGCGGWLNAYVAYTIHHLLKCTHMQSCLLYHLRLPTLPSIPILSQAVFWGADEEISDGGSPRFIVYGYDGLPMQPAQDPDYVLEPMYPEYIQLEDEHMFPAEEQPLPPVDSPTTESPGYVAESDPEEDPEEYEDDETEDGPVDYPMDGGDDGDDDDGDSSGDDADDEDEDEEEEHPAPADSAVVVPTIEPVSPPKGTEPVIPPPSTDISNTGARFPVPAFWLPYPFPPECRKGETLLGPLRIASTQALIDAVTAALPSPPLPPLPPSLYIPPPVDRRDDVPESELPPRKRLCLSTLVPRYEIGESSTARPIRGRGIDYGFVSTVDAEARRQGIDEVGYGIRDTWVDPAEAVPEIAPMTVGEVNTRVTELTELHERDTQDLYALLEDAQDGRTRISQ